MKNFNLSDIQLTKYSFFTGKGGVGIKRAWYGYIRSSWPRGCKP